MRVLFKLVVVCLFVFGCNQESSQIQFFTHEGCPYCEKAMQYIKINYPKLSMQVLEVDKGDNLKLFVRCASKFKLNKDKLGTPLICMGDNYIMGWSKENQKLFNEYVKPFIEKQKVLKN